MKKFVIVIISALVLFVFLMLNYLVWDKENLQNERERDKIDQDWLRGQNRILNTTVEELENNLSDLQKTLSQQRIKIVSLEEEARQLRQDQVINQKNIIQQKEALNLYKSLQADELKVITEDWFLSISENRINESVLFLDKEFTFWNRKYDEEEYIEFISVIDSIKLEIKSDDVAEPFTILQGGEPKIIKANVIANINLKNKNATDIAQGINSLEIDFSYNSMSKRWLILYINTKNIARP